MADFFTAIGDFLKPHLIQISTVVVGGMLLYEVLTGRAIVAGTRRITRGGNPFRYWFWILFHGAVVAILVFAWVSGVEVK